MNGSGRSIPQDFIYAQEINICTSHHDAKKHERVGVKIRRPVSTLQGLFP